MNSLFEHVLELDASGAITAADLPAHGGVYLIADAEDRPIFLAFGQNLRRVVVSRLAAPPSDTKTKRVNLAELAAKVFWCDTFSRFETEWTHWRINRQLNPKHYRDTLSFGPCWFLRLHIDEPAPRFTTVKTIGDKDARYAGPFPTRSSAEAWIQMLEDAFDLCRYQQVLAAAPNGERCAYFDMGKCPAPCDGTLPMETYRSMPASALAFTIGDRKPRLQALRESMRRAADGLAFEQASAIRSSIDKATALIAKSDYAHVGDMNVWAWLIIQRAGPVRVSDKTALIKPFHVRGGSIEPGEPIALADIDSAAAQWIADSRADRQAADGAMDATTQSEAAWLVAKFLFQGERAPGVFLRADSLPSAVELASLVRERFARRGEDSAAEASDEGGD